MNAEINYITFFAMEASNLLKSSTMYAVFITSFSRVVNEAESFNLHVPILEFVPLFSGSPLVTDQNGNDYTY
jgi:hypothetical protein